MWRGTVVCILTDCLLVFLYRYGIDPVALRAPCFWESLLLSDPSFTSGPSQLCRWAVVGSLPRDLISLGTTDSLRFAASVGHASHLLGVGLYYGGLALSQRDVLDVIVMEWRVADASPSRAVCSIAGPVVSSIGIARWQSQRSLYSGYQSPCERN